MSRHVDVIQFLLYYFFMFEKGAEIFPDMIVLHDDGLRYRVDKVTPSTDGYEEEHKINGQLRVAYTQLEDGGFPAGTEWNKDGEEFRRFFTPAQDQPNPNREWSNRSRGFANPERTRFQLAIGKILGEGFTLTNADIREIAPHYGYNATSGVNLMGNHVTKRVIREVGVEFAEERYRTVLIYRDRSFQSEETDLAKTKAAIDERRN